jgi:hypothetical protein
MIWDEVEEIPFQRDDFVNLFKRETRAPPSTVKRDNATPSATDAKKSKPKKKSVLEGKRSQAVAIALSRLPPSEVMMEAIRHLDDSKLSRDAVESVSSILPNSDEVALVQENSGPDVVWEAPEAFFLKTLTVSHISLRLQCWMFRLTLEENFQQVPTSYNAPIIVWFCVWVDFFALMLGEYFSLHFRFEQIFWLLILQVEQPYQALRSACKELRKSFVIKKILGISLAVGNMLNADNARNGQVSFLYESHIELNSVIYDHSSLWWTLFHFYFFVCACFFHLQADGFELPSLIKFADQRGNSGITLLQYILQVYVSQNADHPITKLDDELSCVKKCRNINLVELDAQVWTSLPPRFILLWFEVVVVVYWRFPLLFFFFLNH